MNEKQVQRPKITEVITDSGVINNTQVSTRTLVRMSNDTMYELRSRQVDKDNKTEIELYWFKLPDLPVS